MSELKDVLLYLDPQDTFNKHIVGLAEGFGDFICVCYNKDALIEHWTTEFSEDAVEEDDAHTMAVEWFDYNVIGAYVGEHTPVYVSPFEMDCAEDIEDLCFLDPRSVFDEHIIGLGQAFGGTLAVCYNKDTLLEMWKKAHIEEEGRSEEDAFICALEDYDLALRSVQDKGDFDIYAPAFISQDEWELLKGNYTLKKVEDSDDASTQSDQDD
jgi:hypothetical protein